ncbi:3293_t:CDS:2, partial [Dentiscutata heterogama]
SLLGCRLHPGAVDPSIPCLSSIPKDGRIRVLEEESIHQAEGLYQMCPRPMTPAHPPRSDMTGTHGSIQVLPVAPVITSSSDPIRSEAG